MSPRPQNIARSIARGLDELAEALASGKDLTKKFTCRKVVLELNPIPYHPQLIKETREILQVSQAVFAQFIGASLVTVRKWESGENVPCDMACRFMDEIRQNPEHWRTRLSQLIRVKASS